ncbi:hypothetical protein BpHYR1_042132 [Brachionus plicatilis]|uniref:Uncharacterized protein n=1 Tax=Brachionus plicatilis TaxID=10195 RepID=A0A3M7R2C2_BRAPC|nr:hypothetical protein BpHYR1_042132 [Brachionus plicatilis]
MIMLIGLSRQEQFVDNTTLRFRLLILSLTFFLFEINDMSTSDGGIIGILNAPNVHLNIL